MYIVVIAWFYVALMMAIAEATNSNGTILGAIVTFLLYGAGPIALVVYLMMTPHRKRAIKAREAAEAQARAARAQAATLLSQDVSDHPDAGREASAAPEADVVASVRKES